jgi:Asp-tRNA(Asn)/Glu-tRNA(Gln) amidotransferase A subunit family amidase
MTAAEQAALVRSDAVSATVRIWNVTGQPAVSPPLHETSDGVPVGVQLVGPPFGDAPLLALAAQLEERARGRRDVVGAPHEDDPPVDAGIREVERDDSLGSVET